MITFSFERSSYTVTESDGTLPDTILVRKDIPTEQDYAFNISLKTGDIPAEEGMHTILPVFAITPLGSPSLSYTHAGMDFSFPRDFPIFFPSSSERSVTAELTAVGG